jgi:hypothetical protein
MRPDMAKVIVERPRRGGNNTRRGRSVPDDLQPTTEGMRAPHVRHYGGKELNEYLSPLYRFLRSRAGQPWDQVWSEISKNIRATNAIQQHVRDHVMMWVCTKTCIGEDGEVWLLDSRPNPAVNSLCHFYVHPESGLLVFNTHLSNWKNRWRRAKKEGDEKQKAVSRTLPNGVEIRKHEGIWYEVTLRPVPKPQWVDGWTDRKGHTHKVWRAVPVFDVLLKRTISENYGTYVSSKRQLNHHELKSYGVSND